MPAVDPAPIPEELKQRDQWLLWDDSHDTPRQPHWQGNFRISWSDPEDWHSFPEALAASEQRDSWGIGYVMALDNDDHARGLYGCLDLDGCLDGPDTTVDWVPSLSDFVEDGAYIERSPSGDGLHIPLVGQDEPDWWTDSHVSPDEHEGVEYLTNKFVTFTGDQLGDQHDGVADTNPAEFLVEAYRELNGEAPRDPTAGDSSSHGDDLDEADIDDALSHLNSDVSYPEWRDIAFAVHDWDSGSRGKRCFSQWSRGAGWDADSQDRIDAIWRSADDGGGDKITVATLVHKAMEAGWEPPGHGATEYDGTPTAKELVARYNDEYADASEVPDLFDEDGGANTEQDSGDDTRAVPPDEPDRAQADEATDEATDQGTVDAWDAIYQAFTAAENADERAVPRFQSAMRLHEEQHFANLQENEVLYAYDPDRGIYADTGTQLVRQQLTENLREQYRGNVMSEVLDHIRGRNTVSQDEMGGPEGHIAAQNCVIDLFEETSRPHSHEFMFQSRLGCEFDPDATAPQWRAFLDDVVPSDTERKKLQEFAGYCLHHWGLPYHKALFLVGPTASGKSTFLDAINNMLGEGTVGSLTPQQLTSERFGPAELFGKWANIRNDIPKSTVNNTGMFKEIVAGDPMKAEKKNKDPFFFEPTAKHLFSANQLPEMEVDDEAFFRRILLVPFPETIPKAERDKHLDDKLEAELSGILNWALEGLQRLLGNGSFTGDRSPGHTRETWSKWGDSVSRFANDALTDGNDQVPKSEMYAAYIEYCRQESIPSDTQHTMTRNLKQEGISDGRAYVDGDRKRVFMNVELTGRGTELLEAARSEGGSDENTSRRATGLGSFDES